MIFNIKDKDNYAISMNGVIEDFGYGNITIKLNDKTSLKEYITNAYNNYIKKELSKEEKKHWIEPIVIDNLEDAEKFLQALEQAAAARKKDSSVEYKNITDKDEIETIFNNLKNN